MENRLTLNQILIQQDNFTLLIAGIHQAIPL